MKIRKQYAALPYIKRGKHIEVLLITRRRSKRWIIPKGWPEEKLSASELAALEAFEEAGLSGKIGRKSIGSFCYLKQLDDGRRITCKVDVYPLRVRAQYLDWPEKGQRELAWLKAAKAADLIEEEGLGELILEFVRNRKKAKSAPGKPPGTKRKKKTGRPKKSGLSGKLCASL